MESLRRRVIFGIIFSLAAILAGLLLFVVNKFIISLSCFFNIPFYFFLLFISILISLPASSGLFIWKRKDIEINKTLRNLAIARVMLSLLIAGLFVFSWIKLSLFVNLFCSGV